MKEIRFKELDMQNGSTLVTGRIVYELSAHADNGREVDARAYRNRRPPQRLPDNVPAVRDTIAEQLSRSWNKDAADAIAYMVPALKRLISPTFDDPSSIERARHDVAMFIHRIEHEHRVEAT